MPQHMADSGSYTPTFAEKRLYLVSRAVQCLSDSVHAQATNSSLSVNQNNSLETKSFSEHRTSPQPGVSINNAVRFDVQSPPPITVNNYVDNSGYLSFARKIKSLFIAPSSNNHDGKVIN